jgi:hypothetical protein
MAGGAWPGGRRRAVAGMAGVVGWGGGAGLGRGLGGEI